MIMSAIATYYKNKLNDASDGRETWKTINELLGRDKNNIVPDVFLIDNDWTSDTQFIANKLNACFSSIGEKLASKFQESSEPLRYLEGLMDTDFTFDPFTTAETISVVKLCVALLQALMK